VCVCVCVSYDQLQSTPLTDQNTLGEIKNYTDNAIFKYAVRI